MTATVVLDTNGDMFRTRIHWCEPAIISMCGSMLDSVVKACTP